MGFREKLAVGMLLVISFTVAFLFMSIITDAIARAGGFYEETYIDEI